MAKQVLSNLDFVNAVRITNLPDGVSAQEPATVAQLNAAVEGLAWKDNVKVATQSNLNLASPGATIDGITMSVSDRVLVKNQTAGSENGLYLWNGAAVAMTRSLDCNSSLEFNNAVTSVDQGTSAGASFRQTALSPTVGTTTITWTSFGSSVGGATTGSAGIVRLATQGEADIGTDATIAITPATMAGYVNRVKKFVANFGDGSATSYAINHNLNSNDVQVEVYRVASPFDSIFCDVQRTSVNQVTLLFATAPTSNQFRVVVLG